MHDKQEQNLYHFEASMVILTAESSITKQTGYRFTARSEEEVIGVFAGFEHHSMMWRSEW